MNINRQIDYLKSGNSIFICREPTGIPMLLLEAKFHKLSKVRGSKFLTIKMFTSPPPGTKKLFDKCKEKHKFCTVLKDSAKMNGMYTSQFELNPQNSSENLEIDLFFHRRSRLCDTSRTGKLHMGSYQQL